MTEQDLATPFEQHRAHLHAVAYRMLGSPSEADDAVQEAWLRLNRTDTSAVENLRGWLTTVTARVCLDMLRSRKSRREEPMAQPPEPSTVASPEQEAVMADSVGLALLVVLDTLAPAERLAFVLHDLFAVPFDEIASIVGRTPAAARQLASRARRRVQGAPMASEAELARQRTLVEAFLTALRAGDVEGLVAVLDPDVLVQTDGAPPIRGARAWASQAVTFGRAARFVQAALVDGAVGAILAPGGRLVRALRLTFADDKIAEVEIVIDPAAVEALEVEALPD